MVSQQTLIRVVSVTLAVITFSTIQAQSRIKWSADGNSYYKLDSGEIVEYILPENKKTLLVNKKQLTPNGQFSPLTINNYSFSSDKKKVLIYTNHKKVWRLNTRGDYWVFDFTTNTMKKLGIGRPESSMMFAKFSPDNSKVAYVSEYNIYVEDLSTDNIFQLTTDGNRKLINGSFDWAYEEEFFCRDGFRWSPDSKKIAFWQIDASSVGNYIMVNNIDSAYPFAMPVEYPIAGDRPSAYKIG